MIILDDLNFTKVKINQGGNDDTIRCKKLEQSIYDSVRV